jgi:DNA-binding response OmpR family regulator
MPRMLVVDDEDSILFAMRDYFAHLGYEVDAAHDASEAETLLATHDAYAVAVIDLSLKGAGQDTLGLDLVTVVRAGHPTTTVVVLFTAFGTHEIEREARRRGAVFMQKPVPLPVLGAVIEELRFPADADMRHTC